MHIDPFYSWKGKEGIFRIHEQGKTAIIYNTLEKALSPSYFLMDI